jgi:uncharacterized protein (DUF2252 family)
MKAPVERHLAPRPHLARKELHSLGKGLRKQCPRGSHAAWKPQHDRPDPVQLTRVADRGRVPRLIPLRHGRMLQSPFAFYRGSALAMAIDLAATPATGLRVQACGDAHLANFGGFATPERRIVFDVNDLDETLPAPWEWDIKRLATSFVLACRNNGLGKGVAEDAVRACIRSYRERMADFSEMGELELWYTELTPEKLLALEKDARVRARVQQRVAKESSRSAIEYDFPRLARAAGKQVTIRDRPPTIYHLPERDHARFDARIRDSFNRYRSTLPEHRRVLLDRYEIRDSAFKVVGVGSVGTVCGILLLMASDEDPLFLQVKEARASVLEAYAGRSAYPCHGQRVVMGYLLMQSASDIFLGWTTSKSGRHYYIRQLRDAKISPLIDTFGAADFLRLADWCGHTLARSHARSGEPAAISGYLGRGDAFDQALEKFCFAYADQNERDYELVRKAARAGKMRVEYEQR